MPSITGQETRATKNRLGAGTDKIAASSRSYTICHIHPTCGGGE